ncbi:MAG: HAMP domain-containing protein [Chloroflexi bacterium]|nr:HAMP domain-containing protein [Chloroflexota bacterium]
MPSLRWSSLSFQIIGVMLSLTLGLGLVRTYLNRAEVADFAHEQFERRGIASASAFAAYAANSALTSDVFRLRELIDDTRANNPDVRYVIVLGDESRVLSHSFGETLPRGLLAANGIGRDERYRTRHFSTDEGDILDVAVPLAGRFGAVRMGLSEQSMRADVDRHTYNLLLVTGLSLIPVGLAAYLLARVLVRPLEKLGAVTAAVTRGDFSRQAPVTGQDEIVQLGQAFNAMTESLARSQNELHETNDQLRRRNDELAALNALSAAISHSADRDALLEDALAWSATLPAPAGWVLWQADGVSRVAAVRGVPAEQHARLLDCPDGRVQGGAARLCHGGAPCPAHGMCHVGVPLVSRQQLWGTLHLACAPGACFAPEQVHLLSAVGKQIGLALENLQRSEQQRDEALRRQLLDRTIEAQEEERKRIARELHDEFAQSLTALIVGLQTLEQPETPKGGIRARLVATRSLAVQILQQTRRLIFDLRPSVLDDAGLGPAIRSYAERTCDAHGVALTFRTSGARRLPPPVEIALFRIVQEAVNNLVQHARARHAHITLAVVPERVETTVADDGAGFDVEQALRSGRLGLLGMKERVELLRGTLEIESHTGQGTLITVAIPLPAQPEDSA